MNLKDVFSKETLAKITDAAPFIGAILGPGGAGAGAAIKMIATALGVEATPPAIETALQNNPDALVKIKELELNHKLDWERLLLDGEKARLADVQNARLMRTESEKTTGKRDGNLYALAWLGVIGYLGLIVYIIHWGLPKMTVEIALMVGNLVGIVGAKYSSIYDYFFGSSKGSADKNGMLAAKGT